MKEGLVKIDRINERFSETIDHVKRTFPIASSGFQKKLRKELIAKYQNSPNRFLVTKSQKVQAKLD